MAKLAYRSEIDGLRGVAVLAVVGYHLGLVDSIFRNGFIGVDVFFVISGYLITQILLQTIGSDHWVRDFYLKRVRRLFPTLVVVLLSVLVAGLLLLLPFELRSLGQQVFFGGLFSSNFHYLAETGYFDTQASSKPLLHLWSLGVEEQFYIFFPVLLWGTLKIGLKVTSVLCVLVIGSFTTLILVADSNPSFSYYSPLTRIWELALGGLAATLMSNKHEVVRRILGICGFLLLGLGFLFSNVGNVYPNWSTLLPILGTAIILVNLRQSDFVFPLLSNKLLLFFGKISYPLYLWHWPLISFYIISVGYPPNRQHKYVILIAAILLSWLSTRFIDLPFRKINLVDIRIYGLCLSILAISMGGLILANGDGLPSRIQTLPNLPVTQVDVSKQFSVVNFNNPECLQKFANKYSENYQWWFCRTNSPDSPEILLWGSSYANQYFAGFSNDVLLGKRSLLSIGDCPIQREPELVPPNPCAGKNFDQQHKFIRQLIVKNKSINFVVLAGLKNSSDSSSFGDLESALNFLDAHHRKVFVFYPHIKPKFPVTKCIGRPFKDASWDCSMSRFDYDNFLSVFSPTVEKLRIKYPNVSIYNPNHAFCSENGCSFMISGLPIIRDGSAHLSDWGSELVATDFRRWLIGNGFVPQEISRKN